MNEPGVDGQGRVYSCAQEFWDEVIARQNSGALTGGQGGTGGEWYKSAVQYWDCQSATNNGVLGGFGQVNPADIMDSRKFLLKAMMTQIRDAREQGRSLVAVDCGAGIGRVTAELLLHYFQEVDLVEPSEHLIMTSRRNLVDDKPKILPSSHNATNFFHCGLESFFPEPARYDAVWIQWAIMYLTDEDAISFLTRCGRTMRAQGVIFLKENVCDSGFIVDSDDCSITRSHAYFVELFRKAGLRVAHTSLQKNFPKQLFKVRMYALKCS